MRPVQLRTQGSAVYYGMNLTYYGHACFAVQAGGKTLLFDPFIAPNPLASEIDVGKIEADYILVSHGHGDHVADLLAIAQRTSAKIIAPYEVGSWFEAKGLKNVQAMNHGGAATAEFGRVKLTTAIHSSSMPDGSYGGNPCGFVVESDEGNFYYSGDTALTIDMKLIAERIRLRFAVLPIGDFFTMGVDDAMRAADFVGVRTIVGVHYDTFPPIKLDRVAAMKTAQAAGKELLLPKIGETIEL
ncbi:MAG: metal-dependent hydrolase [Verrucomicrobiota bacterium]|nr:metal-dependent hydrolase [Verrucomicrobiota bacterium]